MRRLSVIPASYAAGTASLTGRRRRIGRAAGEQGAILRLFAFFAFSISASLLTAPAGATIFPLTLDSSGLERTAGQHFADECKEGERRYLVGFAARMGLWLDQIAPICAGFSPTGVVSTSQVGPAHGGGGGLPRVEACPPNAFLTGIRFGRAPRDDHVGFVELTCTAIDGAESTVCLGGEDGCYGRLKRTQPGDLIPDLIEWFEPAVQTCPSGEVATGIQGAAGGFVDGLGLICGPGPQLASPAFVAFCNDYASTAVARAGENLSLNCGYTGSRWSAEVAFHRDWCVGLVGDQGPPNAETAARASAIQQCEASSSQDLRKNIPGDILVSNAPATEPPPPPPTDPGTTPPATPPPPPPGPAADVCGPSGGTAVVTIADPKLDKLNVRAGPGGKVLGTIARGTAVSVIGPCGPAGSAGLAAPGQPTTGSGWCQIDKPIAGCVSAQFLALGEAGGAAGLSAPPPAPPPAQMPLPSQTGAEGPGTAATVVKAANVRSSPQNANNVIGKLPAGTQVLVTGCQSTWCRIAAAGGAEAWVHQSLLAFAGPAGGGVEPPGPIVPPQPQGPMAPPQGPVTSGCDRPAGLATIVIPDPNLDKLNVRESPGGKVISTIPEGGQVSIIGECGAENAAGIAAPSGQGGTPGWCQIESPVTGCVSTKYLAPGSGGAAGVANSPEASAAIAPSFAGSWDTVAGGVAHSITFNQDGASVTGTYAAADGSSGTISGTVKGKVLSFSWSQADGISGIGKFTLSGDGQSFKGSYGYADNPDVAQGSWGGTRQ